MGKGGWIVSFRSSALNILYLQLERVYFTFRAEIWAEAWPMAAEGLGPGLGGRQWRGCLDSEARYWWRGRLGLGPSLQHHTLPCCCNQLIRENTINFRIVPATEI